MTTKLENGNTITFEKCIGASFTEDGVGRGGKWVPMSGRIVVKEGEITSLGKTFATRLVAVVDEAGAHIGTLNEPLESNVYPIRSIVVAG